MTDLHFIIITTIIANILSSICDYMSYYILLFFK
nr:MAG TPA: hypothetical protein [Caudoviricetes sp.]